MRESLTVLAGLLVLALLAALVAPGFVDWRLYRPQIEARLSGVLGVETRVDGAIGLTLLPSPTLTLAGVRIGDAETAATSRLAVETMTVELALSALARGEFRFSKAEADGATLSLMVDETGAVVLPRRIGSGLPVQTSLASFSVRRSAVVWHEAGKAPVTLSPITGEMSAVSLAGPWRIDAEVAGASVRIATGEIESDGRLRGKGTMIGDDAQIGFDGSVLLPVTGGRIRPAFEGAFSLAPGGAAILTGRLAGNGQKLDLTGLTLDIAGGAARLEGEGQFLPAAGTGSMGLRARRLDIDALILALEQRPGFERALQGLPGRLDLGIDLDQMIWRGEDFSTVALRGSLSDSGLGAASASMRIAGALIGATGDVGFDGISGKINVKAEDARRSGLALLRAGLDPALADAIASLGQIDGEAVGAWNERALRFDRLIVTGGSGVRFEASGDLTTTRLAAKATLHGLDLGALPPAESFSGLIGPRDLALDLGLERVRFRNAPPGTVKLDLRREATNWRLLRLAIDGFGGVAVTGSGALLAQGGEIAGRIRAPRFEALAALAGPLLPDFARQALARVGDGLSRLDAGYRLTRVPSGETGITLDGAAQLGRLALSGRLDNADTWTQGSLRVDLNDRRQAFAALGLPVPATGGAGRFTVEAAPGRLTGALAGPGLSVVVEQAAAAAPLLTVQAEGPAQVLPDGAAKLLPDAVLDGRGRLRLEADAVGIDDLVVNLGDSSASGVITLPREGPLTGRLSFQRADLRGLLGATLGGVAPTQGALWSSARFGGTAAPGEMVLDIAVPALVAADGITLRDARFRLQTGTEGLKISDLTASYGGGSLTGQLMARRDGGLALLSGRLGLAQVDLAMLSGGMLGGKVSGQVDLGGSGESPARLVAGLSGAGALSLSGASLSRFDPQAYGRIIASTGEDASESDTLRLQQRVTEALDRGAWPLGDVTLPFTLAAGLARLQPLAFDRAELRAEASGMIDIRALTGDIRLSLRPLGPLPKGWPSAAPQLGVAWRGPLTALRRETDVGALANVVAARALAREIERVEAFEADARERAAQSRRLRAERETRENERKLAEFLRIEEARRVAEEARRLAEERRAEEARRIEEARRVAEEARRLAEERRAEEARRIEDARRVIEENRRAEEARRRAEAEERARAAAARLAPPPPQPGPLILPGAPREAFPGPSPNPDLSDGAVQPLAPPIDIESVPRPLSRSLPPN